MQQLKEDLKKDKINRNPDTEEQTRGAQNLHEELQAVKGC